MKKLRTLTMLQDYLDEDFAWRLKEIADLKLTVRSAGTAFRNTIIRAGIPLLYAHWEGFVKNSSRGYINFINAQGLSYDNLKSCFIVFGLKQKLHEIGQSRRAKANTAAMDFILSELGKRADLNLTRAVDTESNLSARVFENIASSIGINPAPYEPRYNLIDESLLKRRNEIAHGEYLDVGPEDYRTLADEVIHMMRLYKTDIENAAVTSQFLR
jgi:hypothetical protein